IREFLEFSFATETQRAAPVFSGSRFALDWIQFTARVIAPLCVIPPLTPVTITEYVPGATPVVEIVKVVEPEPPVMTFPGLKLIPAPAGRLDTDRVTFPLKPPLGTMLTV